MGNALTAHLSQGPNELAQLLSTGIIQSIPLQAVVLMLQASRLSSEVLILQSRLLQPLGHRCLCLLRPRGRGNKSQVGTCFEPVNTSF